MTPNEAQENAAALEQIERVLSESAGRVSVRREVRDRAHERALALLEDRAAGAQTARMALLEFARDMLADLAVELAARPPALKTLIETIESVSGLDGLELGREVLRAPQLLQLPSSVAIEVELAVLVALSGARGASLWRISSRGEPERIVHAGHRNAQSRRTRRLARRLIAGDPPELEPHSEIAGVVVGCADGPAALIACWEFPPPAERVLLLEAAIPILAVGLAREELPARSPQPKGGGIQESNAIAAAERRLARLRFDLHDGPQQDVLLLAEDLRLFRSQMESVLRGHEERERALAHIDDLEARLVALDGDLRRISVATQSPLPQGESLPDVLAQLTNAFAERTRIEPEVRLQGNFSKLTDSQHIAILGLIREALSNIREHSEAERVTITVVSTAEGIEATVTDDGRGFDPETTLVHAARHGHLGLVGMHERLRMLGGVTRIDSRPGGPTVISASLPPAPAGALRADDC